MNSHSAPRSRRRRAIVVFVLIAAIGGGVAMMRGKAPGNAEASKPDTVAPLVFGPADVAQAELLPLARTLQISGSLAPLAQSLVKSKVSGEVLRLHVREGETVARGQVLAEIDTVDLRNRLESAQADLEERRARLMIATRNRETNEALLKRNFISQSAFDQTQGTWQGAEAAVRGGEAQVRLARTAVEDAVVRAPLSGIVAKRHVNPGERVGPESPLLVVVDLTRLELEVTVPASDIGEIKVGQVARFKVDGYGERDFSGKVNRVNPVAEAGSRAIKLFIEVPNTDQTLKGGMFAQGGLVLSEAPPLPVVPQSAVIEEAGQSYLYAISEGKLDKRAVRLGTSDAGRGVVAVSEGLKAGETVVRLRMNGLKAGAPAELRAAKAAG